MQRPQRHANTFSHRVNFSLQPAMDQWVVPFQPLALFHFLFAMIYFMDVPPWWLHVTINGLFSLFLQGLRTPVYFNHQVFPSRNANTKWTLSRNLTLIETRRYRSLFSKNKEQAKNSTRKSIRSPDAKVVPSQSAATWVSAVTHHVNTG